MKDFLPSGKAEYSISYEFPLPNAIKKFFLDRTRSGTFLSEVYDEALRRLHLRRDFFDDILRDFAGYQQRFGRDVVEMNAVVRAAGLPPLVALVVDQYPWNPRGRRIAKAAEEHLLKAGADVIPTEGYYRNYAGRSFYVSRWEGHPNEVANYIWTNMISEKLRRREDLQEFVQRTPQQAVGGAGPMPMDLQLEKPN